MLESFKEKLIDSNFSIQTQNETITNSSQQQRDETHVY